jgi:hypothetical protein
MSYNKVAILQSNYIPWKGYFDIIASADAFVVYDHVQYTKNDWRNRNKIKTSNGLLWLTIPVKQVHLEQRINETQIQLSTWNKKHWETIKTYYAKTPYFKTYASELQELYLGCTSTYLSEINLRFLRFFCEKLGINTPLITSTSLDLVGDKTSVLVNICKQLGSSVYISGPSAKNYIQQNLFQEAGIKIEWMDYQNYPVYRQLYPPFEHGVSILDLFLNEGHNATNYLKYTVK